MAAVDPLPEATSEQRVPQAPAAGPTPENATLTLEFAKFASQHTTEYIRLADMKASILTTLLSANLFVLVQRGSGHIAAGHTGWRLWLIVAACLYATVTLVVVVNIIRPRLFRNAERGYLFWEDIASHPKPDYASGLQNIEISEMIRQLGEHNHNLSRSALRKFKWLRVGFRMALVSIALSAILILVTSWKG